MRNIFVEKIIHKMERRNFSQTLFWKSKIDYISESIVLKFCTVCFYCMVIWGNWNIVKPSCRLLAFTLCSTFLKNKKRPGTSLPASFFVWFLKKNISFVIFYLLTKFHCLVAFNSRDIEQYVSCNCLITRLWHYEFQN